MNEHIIFTEDDELFNEYRDLVNDIEIQLMTEKLDLR